MSALRVGFIGVGGVAQPHLQNLSAIDGVQITAVCDTFADRAQQVGEKYNAAVYSDYKQLLAEQTLDAVYVCLIPAVHGEIELDLAKKRIPFYVEKPVHLDLDACQRVLDELEQNPIVTGVGYHWRYTAAARAVREFVSGKKVSIVEGWWYGGFVGAPWWRQMSLSGGQLVEQTTHIVDMARYLAGEVKSVYAIGATGAMADVENYDIHDTSIATLNFDSGAIGQITSGCIAGKHGGSKVDITVKGRDWQAWTNASTARWSSEDSTEEVDSGQAWNEQLGNGDNAFINAVRNGDSSGILSDYRNGVQSFAISAAANESMATGQVVAVRRFV